GHPPTLRQWAVPFDAAERVSAERRPVDAHPSHLAQRELRSATIGCEHERVDVPLLSQTREIRLEARRRGEHRIRLDDLATQAPERRGKAEAQHAAPSR